MEGFLRGLYQSGVGNPEVQHANEAGVQERNAAMTAKMAEQGMVPGALPADHPISQKVGSFISSMFGGASTQPLLASAFKQDPTTPVPTINSQGVGSLNPPGYTPKPGEYKRPMKEVIPFVKQQANKSLGGAGNVTWENATPEQQRMAKAVYDGNVDVSKFGFRERTAMNFLANEYATNNGLDPYKSYLTGTHEKTANAFTSGKFGQNINSLNTAMGHVDSVHLAYQAIGNKDQRWLNVPINELKKQTNDPQVVKLGIALNALRGELATVFKGSAGTDQDAKAWMEYLNENLTPEQAYGAMTEVDDLLRSRQVALEYQRGSGMGQNPGTNPLISPKAEKTRKNLANSPLNPNKSSPTAMPGWDPDKEKRYQEWKTQQ